jgi:hypothetical protein
VTARRLAAYAEGTTVSVEKSRAELDTLLGKHGAQQRGIMSDEAQNRAIVGFVLHDRRYKLVIPLPAPTPPSKSEEPRAWAFWSDAQRKAYIQKEHEQACRARWRAIVMLVKAKLEVVRIGLSSVEKEFLADLLLPDGRTAGETIESYVADVIRGGSQGPLALPGRRPPDGNGGDA